jgi:hypothetical protein
MPSGFTNSLDTALSSFMQEREKILRQAEVLQKLIDDILAEKVRMMDSGNPPDLPVVAPRRYQGMRMTAALESYLKERPTSKIHITKVAEDLQVGGAAVGGRPVQNLKITIHNNRKLVARDDNWNIWLAPTGTEPRPPRNVKKKRSTAKTDPSPG